MRTAYRVLALAIAALVVIQAAVIGYGMFAQLNWIDHGGTLDKSALESSAPGAAAFLLHGLNGGIALLLSLALLIISFFAKIAQGVRWAVIVLIATVVQVALGMLSHTLTAVGALHWAVALVLFGVAVGAATHARKLAPVKERVPTDVA
jgi:hypothetical protein